MKHRTLINPFRALSLVLTIGLLLTGGGIALAKRVAAPMRVGSGIFIDSGQNLGNLENNEVDLGDLDGDGDLDAFVVTYNYPSGQPNKVYLNNGAGVFADNGQSLGGSVSQSIALGDLDGDGDLDAFVTNRNQANKVWLNNGAGTFSDSSQSLGSANSATVSLGDVDDDGDLDAFVGNVRANQLWLNNGSGVFTNSGQNLGNSDSRVVRLADLDGDDDLDAFSGNIGANKVWLNNGAGTFTDSGQNLGSFNSVGAALGDLDGDGDLDAFIGNNGPGQANKVWLNNGDGTFTDSGQNLGSSDQDYYVDLGNVDGDGDLDAFVVHNNNEGARVWANDGAGAFSDTGQSLGSGNSRDVALGDLDGDGDLDAFITNLNQPNKVWLNQNADDTTPPTITTPGPITLEATGPSGAAGVYTVTAEDDVDGPLTPSCNPASGSTFPLGDTSVMCSATDAAGNTATASFTITVQDTTPPTVAVSLVSVAQDGFLLPQTVSTFPAIVGARPVMVEVTANDVVGVDSVMVNGVAGLAGPTSWTVTGLSLNDDGNTLTATAADSSGNVTQTSVQVTLDLDLDGDGIHNNVDEDPLAVSNTFSDLALGGVTSGRIVGLDTGITIEIVDATEPLSGVQAIVAGPTGGEARVKVDSLKGAIKLSPGIHILTSGSLTLQVLQGSAAVEFIIDDVLVVVGVEGTVFLEEIIVDDTLIGVEVTAVAGNVTVNDRIVPPGELLMVPLPLQIDIKPGSEPNCFNNNGHGVIPVAILGSAGFDITEIDAATVALESLTIKAVGKNNQLLSHIEDVNGDGFDDLVVQIEDEDGVLELGDTTARLTGHLLPAFGSTPVEGSDSICIVP